MRLARFGGGVAVAAALACVACVAPSAGASLRRGQDRLEAGDPEGALGPLERATALDPESAEAWFLLGRASEEFGIERARVSGSAVSAPLAFEDAERAYGKAADLRPQDPRPRLGLVRAALRRGDFAAAASRAAPLEEIARSAPESAVRREAIELRAQALVGNLSLLLAEGSAGTAEVEAAAREAIREGARLAPSWEGRHELEAALARALGRTAEEKAALLQGLEANPDSEGLHVRLVALLREAGDDQALRSTYEDLASRRPRSPATLWYLGYARILAGDARRRAEAWEEAEGVYASAVEAFEGSARLRSDFADSADRFATQGLASMGWCRHGARDLDGAADFFARALERRPEILRVENGFGSTLREGASSVVIEWIERSEHGRSEAFLGRLLAAAPDEADWWSNLGYVRWERGMAAEAEEQAEEARGHYERSLAAHERALALVPDDPRSMNDCVLLLYYHLGGADERVEALCRRAIEVGGSKMEPLETSDPLRRDYEEAIGNAYQNLGALLFEKRGDLAAAKAAFEKSLEHYPYTRARVRWYLGQIEQRTKGAASPAAAGPPR